MRDNVKLPHVPSELIRIALKDLAKAERSPRYVVKMDHWHESYVVGNDIYCAVCMAGAVMAFSLKDKFSDDTMPDRDHGLRNSNALLAINAFRQGHIGSAFSTLGVALRGFDTKRMIIPYDSDRKQFKIDMRRLATDLAEAGL